MITVIIVARLIEIFTPVFCNVSNSNNSRCSHVRIFSDMVGGGGGGSCGHFEGGEEV